MGISLVQQEVVDKPGAFYLRSPTDMFSLRTKSIVFLFISFSIYGTIELRQSPHTPHH